MFLHELTTEQKRAFLVLARQVIAADERLAMQEVERLEALYREADVPAETSAAPDVVGDVNYMFDTPRARAVVLLELLLVAYADGDFDARENQTIQDAAKAMGLSETHWAHLHDWARRLVALRQEAEVFEVYDR